ncbi:hypothetical protein ABIA95_000331 [Bradyrhizobium sp. LA8.1]
MLRETRPMKVIRRFVVMLTLTLMGATSMTDPSVAQTQAISRAMSPATTGVMVILTVKAGVTREQVMAVMPAEIQQTVQLNLNGKIREWYSRGDGRGAVFLVDAGDVAGAQAIMEDLPLARQDLIDHEYVAIGPLLPLRLLMANPERRQ